ncbi:synergin gamma [Nephila pilipes]|uniref:Synergin gamma n=1 Tax=Nephila pilipes TaxID=299642 RepID=A0A8X6R5B4_NEPPI|nr:synergin gamma [Nephila pilipes]
MSNPLRPTIGPQPAMPGRVIAPVCTTGAISYDSCAPSMIPVPNAYGLITAQPNPYMQHPSFTQQSIPNRVPLMNAMPAVPGPLPGMFVSVAPINAGLSHPNMDPAKLLEEQKRLEKERNFQLQQQRLKQFTIAGKKGSLNAENLIDSMFGKVQPKQTRSVTNSSTTNTVSSEPPKPVQPVVEVTQAPSVTVIKQEILPSIPSNPQRPKKELETMMRECSDLSRPQKANKFSKPSVKELTPSSQQRYTFIPSNKSVDWKNLQGLEEVFVTKKPRFPPWCSKEYIPELFKQVEVIVTNNGTTVPDTKLLFPILISSGLPQQLLGHIWELVNQSAPGQLTIEEMYAALALIAVAQAGHPIKTVDILHKLPSCPIPQLQCFTNLSQPIPAETQSQSVNAQSHSAPLQEEKPIPTYTNVTSDQNSHLVIRPSAISLKDVCGSSGVLSIPENKNETVNSSKNADSSALGFISSPDDDFDDFKSATPTAVNFSMHTPSSDSVQVAGDFADFKQAPPLSSSMTFTKDPTLPPSDRTPLEEQDLMSPEEDKYSVFRSLQQVENTDDWGDFSTVTTDFINSSNIKQSCVEDTSQNSKANPSELHSNPTVRITNSSVGQDFFKTNNLVPVHAVKEEDDFGEFLHAESSVPTVDSVTSQLEDLDTNFADFSNFKEAEFHHEQPNVASLHMSQPDDEFSDFASSLPVPCKPELGSEFFFRNLKDNISLAESQSVSSLELGTFDGGGHSGESKSSLSRQGSIPSLDLKSAYTEGIDNEECFGEFQSPVTVGRASKSPSPAKDVKGQESNNSSTHSLSLNFQNSRNVPLTDKYSVIRAEESKDEDQHISCWVRCLQSSVNIIQNTMKIFNQMSCSSVCNEILRTEEGENYIKDVIEVYKVVRRIAVASKSASKQTTIIIDLLNEADQAWNTICGFIAGSTLMPKEASLEFSSVVLGSNAEDNTKACGLCLLNIEMRNKFENETLNLSYGGRNYHSTCANLWVNCVDPLLPALSLPQLL